ncbi:glycosyltransferase [Streptomyces luteireticuli]|uniref:glycosyltransferase n=1 Tax=Streptomyces luteireticuli TaxID=173858 RepID=UPI0035580347
MEFHRAGTDWTCDPAVQQAASEIWKESGNAPFNRYVFGRLRPDRAEAKARDLIAAWTRSRPDLVIAECSDLGAHLAAKVLDLPVVAAGNGLGPALLDLWDTDIAPASPPRIKVVERAPQPALLHRADLFVTHGGRASLLAAVQGKTPALGMGVLADQPDNTTAFARRGLGRTLQLTAKHTEIADTMTAVQHGDDRVVAVSYEPPRSAPPMLDAIRSRLRRRDDAALSRIRAEITAFGEALAAHDFVPNAEHGPELIGDYERALDAYEQAKRDFVGDRNREDAQDVLRALDEGRHALACVDARLAGRPLPRRHPLCFFDPRHGPSTAEVRWSPPEGAARTIAVCAADAVRLGERCVSNAPVSRPVADPVNQPPAEAEARASGVGRREFGLLRPDPTAPAILVFRVTADNPGKETALRRVRRRNRPSATVKPKDQLLRIPGDFTARFAVPVREDGRPDAWFEVRGKTHWEAWLESAEGCRCFETSITGNGWEIVRYTGGGTAWAQFLHEGRGEVCVEQLGPQFQPAQRLLKGYGAVGPGRGSMAMPRQQSWLAIACRGKWSITVERE